MAGKTGKTVCFGEIMLRLSPPGYERFVQTGSFVAGYAGGEANVAVSLANFGYDSYFVTKVPRHEIGQAAVNRLRSYGVCTRYVARGGKRLGIYFLETGASQRPSKVVYDRANSAISQVAPGEFDWDTILDGADWFHFTGITPALGAGPVAVTMEAVKMARAKGIKVSADLNYRKKLWSSEEANRVMSGLMEYVNVAIGNEEDAEMVFGIKAADSDVTAGSINWAGYQGVAKQLMTRFKLEKVAITLRESLSASDNNWSAMLYDGQEFHFSRQYKIHIVDRVGGGDSFAAGLIHALLAGKTSVQAVEFAAAASCLKHSIFGDFNLVAEAEVEALAGGDASGRVQR